MTTKSETSADPHSFQNFVDLMALHAEAVGRMAMIENELQDEFLKLVDERRKDFASLQETIATTEESIEAIALVNPDWFKKAKTLKTPYGQVAFRKSTKLVVKNEEATIILIEAAGEEAKAAYLRTNTALDLEALEKLEDAELKRFRITRETSDSCTVKAAKIDLGKAVAKAAEKAA